MARTHRTASKAALLTLAVLAASALLLGAGAEVLEGFEEEPKAAAPARRAPEPPGPQSLEDLGAELPVKQQKPAAKPKPPPQPMPLPTIGLLEVSAVCILAAYLLNVLYGRSINYQLAQAWSAAYAQPNGIFDKNFSSIGIGNATLAREAGNIFKFYASGRRHVQGLLATLKLRARQDLLSSIWGLISPSEDAIVFEALMAEASMPPIVLVVGTPKAVRRLDSDHQDVATYTRKLQAAKDIAPTWPNEKLHIRGEHSTIFAELFADARVLSTLNPTGPHAKAFKYFRSMHFTNDLAEGTHKRVLRFTFALPPAGAMEDIAPLIALVPLFIDLVGTYKPNPELRKKAEAARQKTATDNETDKRKARQEALLMRKQEKLLEEKARLARLAPAERQKAEEKLQKKMMDKQMRKRSVRVG